MALNKIEMGTAMYEAVKAVGNGADQEAAKNRMIAIAGAIIDHFTANATISPLQTTSTPAGDPVHTHSPKTISTTGAIS